LPEVYPPVALPCTWHGTTPLPTPRVDAFWLVPEAGRRWFEPSCPGLNWALKVGLDKLDKPNLAVNPNVTLFRNISSRFVTFFDWQLTVNNESY